MPPASEQLAYLMRGIDRVVPEDELQQRLSEDRPLRVKLGVDPTAPDVHLGWVVVLDVLRRFQELGHTAVLIVGDFTAQVGDPSGTSQTRSRLTPAQVRGYAERCLDMLRGLLLQEPLEIRYNSEWLAVLGMEHVLDLASQVTVAQMLERDDFAQRVRAGKPISLIEFLYPLLQGMDSVAVAADVELGGTDQLWNLLVGRQLQARHGLRPQVAMTVPLLVGTDGKRKMSQSFDNYISVKDSAGEMFGKVMSLPDEVMGQFFLLATRIPEAEISGIEARLASGELHPGEAKRRLGRAIVERYWGGKEAEKAERAFDSVFREHEIPEDVPEAELPADDPVWIPGLLRDVGLVASSSEGRRLITQGAVRVDGTVVESEEIPRSELVGRVTRVGKRRFMRFVYRGGARNTGGG